MDAAIIESSPIISTTGGFTWPAARRLAAFLEQTRLLEPSSGSQIRVLELGSGTGWLGITLALNAPNALLVLTEQEEGGGIDHLRHNVNLNTAKVGDRVTVLPCDWRDYSRTIDPPVGRLAPDGQPWDYIIGSDLIYVESGAIDFPRVLAATATQGHTTILYCHTKHRFDYLDLRLQEELAMNGMKMVERDEGQVVDRPPSPPPLTELFPDQRIAVYDISWLLNGRE